MKILMPADQDSPATRIPELDGIRAVAILLVIGCHYGGFSSLSGGLLSYGWIGVDIFFVLSGFLITSVLIRLRGAQAPLKMFYTRRILRIFPVYYLMILTVSTISIVRNEDLVHLRYYLSRFLFLQSFHTAPMLFHRVWIAIRDLNFHHPIFQRGILPHATLGAPLAPWANSLGHAWSLSIEEYFYILWAPLVIILRHRRTLGFLAVSIFAASLLIQYLGFSGLTDYFGFFFHIDTIMAGSMLALFLRWRSRMQNESLRIINNVLRFLVALLSSSLVAILLLNRPALGDELRYSISFMVLGLPILSILLAIGLGWIVQHRGGSSLLLRLLRSKPACYLGTISYSLYLFHVPVYYCLLRLAAAIRFSGYLSSLTVSVMALLLSILCSAISWRYLETPILSLKEKWAPAQSSASDELVAHSVPCN